MKMDEALEAVQSSGKRNFSQTVDMIINLKNIDVKKPENKISKDVVLPHGRGRDVRVALISDTLPDAISRSDIDAMARDKKLAKKTAKSYDFFLCDVPLMPVVGRSLGRYLGPAGKMPKPMPPGRDPKPLIDIAKKSVRIRVANAPTIQVPIGTEQMSREQLRDNAMRVIDEVKKSLPGKAQIRNASLKLTMGKPVRVEV